jgi:ferredoxin
VIKRRLVLEFPKQLVEQPITYRLIKEYDIEVNILKAKVTPDEEGRLMVEFKAKKSQIEEAISFLKDLGVKVIPLAQDIIFKEDKCTHCTYCVSLCPTGAFSVKRPQMEVNFDKDLCILCEQCVNICPYKAIEIKF